MKNDSNAPILARHLLSSEKQGLKNLEFEFFHPFFAEMILKYGILSINDIRAHNRASSCLFTINHITSFSELYAIFITISDEFCGLLLSLSYEETIFFTTNIQLDPNSYESEIKLSEFPQNFLIETEYVEDSPDKKRAKIVFRILKEDLVTVFSGTAFFTRPRKPHPHSKF